MASFLVTNRYATVFFIKEISFELKICRPGQMMLLIEYIAFVTEAGWNKLKDINVNTFWWDEES